MGSEVIDYYAIREARLNTGHLKYGPQTMVSMEKQIYVGGAVTNSAFDKLCPTLSLFGFNPFVLLWSYQSPGCSQSMSIDLLYADHMNDKIYGLMVPRDYNGELIKSNSYYLLVAKASGYHDDCT